MPRVLATGPADNGFVPAAGEEFFVRFNQPVDHMQSRLVIKRGDSIVATLQPRLKTEPNVLFARSSGLPAGTYTLVWIVRTLDGQPVTVGEIAFKAEGK
jgi:methionine-rich copper-binding protein CopC